jgi:16S rRNA (cytidine1402-2'-O)-methyltransferase
VRGEITVVVSGAEPQQEQDMDSLAAQVRRLADEGMRLKDAAAQVASGAGVSKKTLYDLAVRI